MLHRCTNRDTAAYADYGGRGITVCPEWRDFRQFLADMGKPPPKHEIDRIDNNKGYSKDNCRWATRTQNANNRRNNQLVTMDGVVHTLGEWAVITGLPYHTIYARIVRLKWDPKFALTQPVGIAGKFFRHV